MAKKAKTFRLSEQALENLAKVVSLTGSSETAVIEIALAYVVNLFERKDEKTDRKTDEETKRTRHAVVEQIPQTQPPQPKWARSRKRRR